MVEDIFVVLVLSKEDAACFPHNFPQWLQLVVQPNLYFYFYGFFPLIIISPYNFKPEFLMYCFLDHKI